VTRDGSGRKTMEHWGVMHCFLPFASVAPVSVAGSLGGCGEAERVRKGEVGDLGNGDGEAQRTGRLLLSLPLLLPSASLVSCKTSSERAMPVSKFLYGLLDLLVLVEAARAMALRFLDTPMRFIMSFSIAGMRIERSLCSFLLAVVLCGRAAKVSRVTCSVRRDVLLDASQLLLWTQEAQWAVV